MVFPPRATLCDPVRVADEEQILSTPHALDSFSTGNSENCIMALLSIPELRFILISQ